MQNFRTIKGTHDLLPEELNLWREVGNSVHTLMQQNGYGEIRTAAFENTELFLRGIHQIFIWFTLEMKQR